MSFKNALVYLIVIILIIYPVAASGATLNRWILNITLNEDGSVSELIQVEFENTDTNTFDGFSFIVPASDVSINEDEIISIPFIGQEVSKEKVQDGTKITFRFNKKVESGGKWNGRFGLKATDWATKQGNDYSVAFPIKAPIMIIGGKDIPAVIPIGSEIRSQVFFPKSVEVTSVEQTPKERPYKKLLQNNLIVITWFAENLNIGDTIKIKGSYSDTLNKIVKVNEKSDSISKRLREAKSKGMDVSSAESHFKSALDYINYAETSFWESKTSVVDEYTKYADSELNKADELLNGKIVKETSTVAKTTSTPKESSGFGLSIFIFSILIICLLRKRKC